MRRLALVVALCGTFQVLSPAAAQAWFEKIDQLSGPGPFWGWDLQFRFACVQDPNVPLPATAQSSAATNKTSQVSALDDFKGFKKFGAGVLGAGCVTQLNKSPVAWLNVRVGQLWSKGSDNHLKYETEPEDRGVNMWIIEPTWAVFVDDAKFVQLNVGAGLMRFYGKPFESFTRFYWKPVEFTLTPAAKASSGWRGLAFTVGLMVIPKGFDAEDFGAIRGTYHTDQDILTTASVTYHFRK